jgi:hypothetical protein
MPALAMSWGHEATDFTVLAFAILATAAVSFIAGRLFGCAHCRAVHEQEMTLVKRLLGDRELHPVQRHRLTPRRRRPHTAAELLELLEVNGALLTPSRWRQIEALHQRLGYRELPRERALLDEPEYEPWDIDEMPVPR